MCGLFPGIIQKFKTSRQGRPQVLVPLYLLDRKLRPSPLPHPLTLDGLAAGDLHWIRGRGCGGHFNRILHVLVSLPQEDWVRKASSFFPFTPQIWLSFVHRTDSMIMTLMTYSINTGLLTR